MTGKSYELPDDITGLGGMVTWADEHGEWHTEVFEFLADARYAFREHVRAGDVAYLERLVALDRRQALDPVSYDVMEIDPRPGRVAVRPRSRMTRALLASAVVMDAAGWACTAQGAYGLARGCFAAALPFIAAWVVGSLRD